MTGLWFSAACGGVVGVGGGGVGAANEQLLNKSTAIVSEITTHLLWRNDITISYYFLKTIQQISSEKALVTIPGTIIILPDVRKL